MIESTDSESMEQEDGDDILSAIAEDIQRTKEEQNAATTSLCVSGVDIEEFIKEQSIKLVKSAVDAACTAKKQILTATDAEEIAALAGLISAAASTLDTLNKQVLVKKKEEAQIRSKRAEIEVKSKMLNTAIEQATIVCTQQEMLKMMTDARNQRKLPTNSDAKPIDVEVQQVCIEDSQSDTNKK